MEGEEKWIRPSARQRRSLRLLGDVIRPTMDWFTAARSGNDKLIARLLAQWPDLITEQEAGCANSAALFIAARAGHDKVVAQLLVAGPHLARATASGVTPLHYAASGGHEIVVEQLLAANPSLITSTTNWGATALSYAAEGGHEKVFAQLLAAHPDLIDKDASVLHCAAQRGHDNLVAQILSLRPEKISEVNGNDWTALKCAVHKGHEIVAERLLAIRPDEVYEVPKDNYTLLHAATGECGREFVAKLWRMNPQALHVACCDQTPFHIAIVCEKNDLIELFQWSLSFDEIVDVHTHLQDSFEERYRPVMEKQCERLLGYLNQDVICTVFEYLGFETRRTSYQRLHP